MANGKLDFFCDEGLGSAFTGSRGKDSFPPLESLKGAVETDAQGHPRRIVVRGSRAVAVEYERKGLPHRAEADREIVLSAGAYGSPTILLRSGIGLTWRFQLRSWHSACDHRGSRAAERRRERSTTPFCQP